jgi:predicted DNA-binding transcriptional regulator AlpA
MIVMAIVKMVWEIMMVDVERAERETLGSPADVAAHLQLPVKTLAEWRARKVGPQYLRVGRYVRYRWQDVEEWLAERKVQ